MHVGATGGRPYTRSTQRTKAGSVLDPICDMTVEPASAAMTFSSVSVITNALRLNKLEL
jgi:hypothetical protein